MDKRPTATIVDHGDDLRSALEQALQAKGQVVVAWEEDETNSSEGTSKIYIELPSDLSLLEPVADYLMKRLEQAWSMPPERCIGLTIALRESLINAIDHGNHSDAAKLVRIAAEISDDEVRFTIEDDGVGFNVDEVPHPGHPANLLKSSGRGVLFIRSMMDETRYEGRGNCLTMIKKRASLLNEEPMRSLSPDPKS